MIHNPFKLLFFILIVVIFTSCDWLESETVEYSSNPTFVSLTFTADDSIPALSTAYFSLEWDTELNDSVIVNLDSLPYNTAIDSVIPVFTFYSTSAYAVYLKDSNNVDIDTTYLSGTDTLNFNQVYKIINYAADGVTSRIYPIKVNVHKVEANLYQWFKVKNQIFSHPVDRQKAIYFNNTFFYYTISGSKNYLYTSQDAINWTEKSNTLSNFPVNANIRELIEFQSKLYFTTSDAKLFSSVDGFNWNNETVVLSNNDYSFTTLLYSFNSSLFAILKSKVDNSYHFASSSNAIDWFVNDLIPVNFPISDFAALSFTTRRMLPKVLVTGGYSASGNSLKNVWSTENGSYWLDYSTENGTHGYVVGSSIIAYDDSLLLFGGLNTTGSVIESPYLISRDEGLSWSVPDTTYNRIRQMYISSSNDTTYTTYEPRAYQSVVYVKSGLDHLIYLIGGVDSSNSKVYSDVWIGKLNRLSFLQ